MVIFRDLKRQLQNQSKKNGQLFGIYPIKKADDLLNTTENQTFINAIKSIIKPTNFFSEFYLPAMEKFAEFVQNIPEHHRDFFGQQSEFLTHGLERVSRAISLCLNHFFPKKNDFSIVSRHEALQIYATFSAALFLDVGKLAVKYIVRLYDKKALPLEKWDPYTSSMLGQGNFYKFDYVKKNFNNLRQFVTPILARQLLDSIRTSSNESGFNWIASDPEILEVWFALLTGQEDRIPMTSFMAMIPRAEIEIIENYRKKIKVSTLDSAGEAFLKWLRKEIKQGKISINGKEAGIYVTEKQIFLSTSLFQSFAEANSSCKHPEIIERQFVDVAKLYQIPVNGVEQEYREKGYRANRTIGGLTAIRANEEKLPQQRFLQGGVGLLSLIMPQPFFNDLDLSKKIMKQSVFPKLTT